MIFYAGEDLQRVVGGEGNGKERMQRGICVRGIQNTKAWPSFLRA